jgi:DNA-directed RNA polymerase subunit RPC12/RpoP
MNFGLKVTVMNPRTFYNAAEVRCFWLGHASWKCGNCLKGFFKVYSLKEHDPECPQCGFKIYVEREKD